MSSTSRRATRSRARAAPASPAPHLLIINKIDLAPLVGADLDVMDRDARKMRGERPFLFTNLKENRGVAEIADFIVRTGGLGLIKPDETPGTDASPTVIPARAGIQGP